MEGLTTHSAVLARDEFNYGIRSEDSLLRPLGLSGSANYLGAGLPAPFLLAMTIAEKGLCLKTQTLNGRKKTTTSLTCLKSSLLF